MIMVMIIASIKNIFTSRKCADIIIYIIYIHTHNSSVLFSSSNSTSRIYPWGNIKASDQDFFAHNIGYNNKNIIQH